MNKLILGLAVLLTWAPVAWSQIPVTDAGAMGQRALGYVQETLTAIRSYTSNINEVQMLQQNIVSLANEAKMLLTLPLNLVNEIDGAIRGYTDLLNQGRGIVYQVQALAQQFEDLYSQAVSGGNGTFLQRAQRMLGQVREAGRVATTASAVFDRLCAQQTRIGQLAAASQAAVGTLQAQQAANQLTAVLAEQQVSVQQLLATEHRLQISERMRQLVLEEHAAQNMTQFLDGMTVERVRGPGEGRGLAAP